MRLAEKKRKFIKNLVSKNNKPPPLLPSQSNFSPPISPASFHNNPTHNSLPQNDFTTINLDASQMSPQQLDIDSSDDEINPVHLLSDVPGRRRPLTISTINARSIGSKSEDLANQFRCRDIDACLVSEIWQSTAHLDFEEFEEMNEVKWFSRARQGRGGGGSCGAVDSRLRRQEIQGKGAQGAGAGLGDSQPEMGRKD